MTVCIRWLRGRIEEVVVENVRHKVPFYILTANGRRNLLKAQRKAAVKGSKRGRKSEQVSGLKSLLPRGLRFGHRALNKGKSVLPDS